MNPLTALMIRRSGRSWWQCRYSDGRVLSEWETSFNVFGPLDKTISLVGSAASRWEEVSKDHMIGLRLLCPNGMAGEVEAPEGFKFFQLKVGYVDVVMNQANTGSNRSTAAHIIGVVQNQNGNCLCRAWEHKTNQLVRFNDNIYHMAYEHIGKLSLDVQGVRV